MQLDQPEGEEPCIEIVRRVPIGAIADAWSPERREQFLLSPGALQPLSVDDRVWPTATDPTGVKVAVTIRLRDMPNDCHDLWLPRALRVDENAELLGYDVADEVMTSGLSNCGYSDEEKSLLRPTWGPQINRFHLFDRADVASQFKSITEARVPEHAPFFVFGLYRLPP